MSGEGTHSPARAGRVALVTYSTKPRGGVVHTLELAEELHSGGADVTVVGMGDPQVGFFRQVRAPVRIVPVPAWVDSLTERVFRWIDALTDGLAEMCGPDGAGFDIVHTQDCISARAACRVRDSGVPMRVVRTVHHVDDFTTRALIDCQEAAIFEPDHLLVVSRAWQRRLRNDYDVRAEVVTNGVRVERFAGGVGLATQALRERIGAGDRFLFLTIGGIEPRKGSEHLVQALSLLRTRHTKRLVPPGSAQPAREVTLAVIGGHSFQDYREYRERVLGSMGELGLTLGRDVVLLGTVSDQELLAWFAAADAFVFPSVEEGWGLVVLEALAAGLPAVTSDIEVFGEFLTNEHDALLTTTADASSLAHAMARVRDDTALADRLRTNGAETAARYSWAHTASQHEALYQRVASTFC